MPKQNAAILLNKYIWLVDYPKTLRTQIKEEIAEMHKLYK